LPNAPLPTSIPQVSLPPNAPAQTSPPPVTQTSPPSPSSPPYVPPHLRQASIPRVGPPLVQLTSIVKGCFYCHNKHPSGFSHMHRNSCPWFHHHIAVGTCHLNDYGELCLGPKRYGYPATPLPFWKASVSQGAQVKARTDGTEWDEDVSKRARNPVVFRD
jgi:hypothetical protein